jgi:hypothetical protein
MGNFLLASQQQAGGSGFSLGNYSPTWIFALDNTSIDPAATSIGDDISTWNDVSGNGVDFTQSGSNRPDLDIVSSEREVNFDSGSTEWLDAPDNSVGEIVLGTDERVIIFKEGNVTATNGAFMSKAVSTSSQRNFQIWRSGDANNTLVRFGGDSDTLGTSDGVPSGVTHRVWVIEVGTTQWRAWVNGVQVQSGRALNTSYADHSGQSMNIGGRTDGSFTLNGSMAFAAMAVGTVTQTDLDEIFAAL